MRNYRVRTMVIAGLAGLSALGAAGIGNATSAQPTTDKAAPNCTPNDVNTTFGERYFGSHTYWLSIHIKAKPGVRCTLPADHPSGFRFADANGGLLPTFARPAETEGPSDPIPLSPGSPAHFELIMEGYALEQVIPAELSLALPGSSQPSVIAWPDDLQYDAQLSYCAVRPGLGDVTDYKC